MWVNKILFAHILADNKVQQDMLLAERTQYAAALGRHSELAVQKTKDDITIDWMRHRVNALEKQNAILMGKATGLHFPVPEIVPTRPNTMSIPNFDTMPDFEDVGDERAKDPNIVADTSWIGSAQPE